MLMLKHDIKISQNSSMQCKKSAFIFVTISGLFWGLDYTLAGEIYTLVTLTFLVSMWLTSAHDL